MAISIGDALLTLGVDTKDLDKGMNSLGASIKKHQKAIGIGMTAVGASILAVGGMTVKTASDIEEMTAKFDVVFGETAEGVKDWAKTTSEAMGRSRFAMMEMAASVQDTFVPMGFARDKAAEMSKTLTALAIDVGSFNNKLDVDVMRDFQSALVGNTETVRKYGIIITAAGIEQEILNQGWVENKSEITEAMKIQARMNMILAGTTDAQGDAIRTSESFANQMKRTKAQVEVVSATIGQHLLPIVTSLVMSIGKAVEQVAAWTEKHPELAKVLTIATIALGALLAILGPILIILPGLTIALPLLGAAFMAMLGPVGLIIAGVTALIAIGILLWKNWDKVKLFFIGMWLTLVDTFKAAWTAIKSHTIDPLLEAVTWIKDTWATLITFFEGLLVSIRGIFNNIAQAMYRPIKNAIDWIINAVNAMIRAINVATSKLGISVPEIPFRMPGLPAFATGGIAMRPMLARVAEKRPEAIIPLDRLSAMMGGTANIIVELDGRIIARAIGAPLVDLIRVRTGVKI